MKVLIATGVFPPEVGGPAKYAKNIHAELLSRGVVSRVVAYSGIERSLPVGVRHIVYFFRALPHTLRADVILALDTGSTGLPALFLAKILRKKFMVRIGGDFLWEKYVERTKEEIRLSDFYKEKRHFDRKELFILRGTRYLTRHADALLFTTPWLARIWQEAYGLIPAKVHILENEYPAREEGREPRRKSFVFVGRRMTLKNGQRLMRVFERLKKTHPDIALDTRELSAEAHKERVKECYAVLVPSFSEVNPNTVIDAVRFGKPFLTTKDTGIYERLKGTGIFVDTLSDTELQKGIEELLDPARYKEITKRVRAFSYTHTWGNIVDELLSIAKTL